MLLIRVSLALILVSLPTAASAADWLHELQAAAVARGSSPAVHWGPDPERYSSWTTHTNRLIPVYTFGAKGAGPGVDLSSYTGPSSVYRSEERLRHLFQGPVDECVCPDAEYLDQTNVFDLQYAALQAGKKHLFFVVFDGMDWETTRAASIWNLGRVTYAEGRGTGTHFQDYDADGTSQYGWMVTSPARDGAQVDVDDQQVKNPWRGLAGGYCSRLGGLTPWTSPAEPRYLVAGPDRADLRHAYTDSASSATSMTSGIKTYNNAINVNAYGARQITIAHHAQRAGHRVGVVTSVPISHATPASAYAHNVHRDDYQDLSRDLLGLPSVSHPEQPLPGMDVVIGSGFGVDKVDNAAQGENFVPGNDYLTDRDLAAIDADRGGRYVVSIRTPGVRGDAQLLAAARRAAQERKRLFGFYGVGGNISHVSGVLPYASADGDFQPAPGVDGKEIKYSIGDVTENPTLADMTRAALLVLSEGRRGFWLLVEAGEVDWANHSNNLDASVGAVNSGDAAVRVISEWVEAHSSWEESLMIVTSDHGHYLVLDRPELLVPGAIVDDERRPQD
jgi:alkaline phosphatase